MEKFNHLKRKINELPKKSGIYLFYDESEIIYIGKAINMKERVKNHFQQPSYRDNLFMNKVTSIDFIETQSEIEALVLEANIIKQHQPKFNVIWRDDKNYFYVAIEKNKNGLPYVFITHQKQNPKTKYIGPFVEGMALKKTLKFLRKVFPFYSSFSHPKNKCAWCHLGLCPGPDPDLKECKDNIKKLASIIQGKRKSVLFDLRKRMQSFSNSQEFEKAAKVREKISALENIMSHAKVLSSSRSDSFQWESAQEKLQKIIGLKSYISIIECYDISNIQGKQATGSMVVFNNGKPDKSQYRKFRIKMEQEPNDIAMLKEVLERRFNHQEWKLPKVILIDGGIAQLNAAISAKKKKEESKIKIISIAKGRQELFIEGIKQPIPLKNLPQSIYNLIKYLDDEAHRFAITYHKKLRKKSLGLDRKL